MHRAIRAVRQREAYGIWGHIFRFPRGLEGAIGGDGGVGTGTGPTTTCCLREHNSDSDSDRDCVTSFCCA